MDKQLGHNLYLIARRMYRGAPLTWIVYRDNADGRSTQKLGYGRTELDALYDARVFDAESVLANATPIN